MARLTEGTQAPDFNLAGNDGRQHRLVEKRGGKVILYFYPKDDTPGCTVEACDFRDNLARLAASGAAVFGVSKDSIASHDRFRDKYRLNFPLLSDPDGQVHAAYGAWGEKNFYGKIITGVIRSTFVIDEAGRIARAWYGVKAKGHVDQVLRALAGESAAPKKASVSKRPAPKKKAPAAKKAAPKKKVPAPKKAAPKKKAPAPKKAVPKKKAPATRKTSRRR